MALVLGGLALFAALAVLIAILEGRAIKRHDAIVASNQAVAEAFRKNTEATEAYTAVLQIGNRSTFRSRGGSA